jgi:osmotically-inducible protein OsmY
MTVDENASAQIRTILEMADRMIVISEQGFSCCDDDGCLLLNGMVRECAYRLRDAAEREREHHGTPGNSDGKTAGRAVGDRIDDDAITAKVRTVLSTHRSTSTMKPDVETRNGQVTLTGSARSAAAKSLVTKLVTAIRGVTGVKNRMTVEAAKAN